MNKKNIVIALLVLGLSIGMAGCIDSKDTREEDIPFTLTSSADKDAGGTIQTVTVESLNNNLLNNSNGLIVYAWSIPTDLPDGCNITPVGYNDSNSNINSISIDCSGIFDLDTDNNFLIGVDVNVPDRTNPYKLSKEITFIGDKDLNASANLEATVGSETNIFNYTLAPQPGITIASGTSWSTNDSNCTISTQTSTNAVATCTFAQGVDKTVMVTANYKIDGNETPKSATLTKIYVQPVVSPLSLTESQSVFNGHTYKYTLNAISNNGLVIDDYQWDLNIPRSKGCDIYGENGARVIIDCENATPSITPIFSFTPSVQVHVQGSSGVYTETGTKITDIEVPMLEPATITSVKDNEYKYTFTATKNGIIDITGYSWNLTTAVSKGCTISPVEMNIETVSVDCSALNPGSVSNFALTPDVDVTVSGQQYNVSSSAVNIKLPNNNTATINNTKISNNEYKFTISANTGFTITNVDWDLSTATDKGCTILKANNTESVINCSNATPLLHPVFNFIPKATVSVSEQSESSVVNGVEVTDIEVPQKNPLLSISNTKINDNKYSVTANVDSEAAITSFTWSSVNAVAKGCDIQNSNSQTVTVDCSGAPALLSPVFSITPEVSVLFDGNDYTKTGNIIPDISVPQLDPLLGITNTKVNDNEYKFKANIDTGANITNYTWTLAGSEGMGCSLINENNKEITIDCSGAPALLDHEFSIIPKVAVVFNGDSYTITGAGVNDISVPALLSATISSTKISSYEYKFTAIPSSGVTVANYTWNLLDATAKNCTATYNTTRTEAIVNCENATAASNPSFNLTPKVNVTVGSKKYLVTGTMVGDIHVPTLMLLADKPDINYTINIYPTNTPKLSAHASVDVVATTGEAIAIPGYENDCVWQGYRYTGVYPTIPWNGSLNYDNWYQDQNNPNNVLAYLDTGSSFNWFCQDGATTTINLKMTDGSTIYKGSHSITVHNQ